MALQLRKGGVLEEDSGGEGYTPFLGWKDKETKFVMFLTPVAEVPKIRVHGYVKVPFDNDKGFVPRTFMCRKDPSWLEESGGECELCDRLKNKTTEKYMALAVELEPNFEGRKVKSLAVKVNKLDDGREFPRIGKVMQSKGNFWSWLGAWSASRDSDITEVAWEILRQGNDKNTKYIFMDLGSKTPNLENLGELPDLGQLIEDMGSLETYKVVASIPTEEPDADSEVLGNPLDTSEFEKLAKELNLPVDVQSY